MLFYYAKSCRQGMHFPRRLLTNFTVNKRKPRILECLRRSASSLRRSTATTPHQEDAFDQAVAALPRGAQLHLDFFAEPITFLGAQETVAPAMAALDLFEIGTASKGKAFTGGGEEDGIHVQAAHSAALAWGELLRHASIWNQHHSNMSSPPSQPPQEGTDQAGSATSNEKAAPMLSCVAVAPLLAQTGVAYIAYVDHLLSHVESGVDGVPTVSLLPLAESAAAMKDNECLSSRERSHLQALHCMLHHHDHRRALMIYLRLLRESPGDCLALSLALDLAHTLGDSDAAFQAATSVAAYWNERRGGLFRPGMPGHNTASAWIALGLAVGGRRAEAERLAVFCMEKGEKLAGGIATWALAHVYDSEGRTAEGISACANSDGSRHFEDCGLLFFDSILSGYGVRFALDREERGRGRSKALRLYDNHFERVLDYSGFATGVAHHQPWRKAPIGWIKSKFEHPGAGSEQRRAAPVDFVKSLFVTSTKTEDIQETTPNTTDTDDTNDVLIREDGLRLKKEDVTFSPEDVLTWMPPTPQFLADATLILLRLTLNGTVSTENYRWENLRNSWAVLIEVQTKYGSKNLCTFEFHPLVCVACSLLASSDMAGNLPGAGKRLSRALRKMGDLLNLGNVSKADEQQSDAEESSYLSTMLFREIVAEKAPTFWLPVAKDEVEEWRLVFKLLLSACDGVYEEAATMDDGFDVMHATLAKGFQAWEFDVRPFLEHALVYAACKCGDDESLVVARSICSRGVTLRQNSPEEWWRYSIVLGLLGDEVASENALANSLAFGGGQGIRKDDVS